MAIKQDTLDDLFAGRDPKAVFSKDGLFDELKKALAERVLNAELEVISTMKPRRVPGTGATALQRRRS